MYWWFGFSEALKTLLQITFQFSSSPLKVLKLAATLKRKLSFLWPWKAENCVDRHFIYWDICPFSYCIWSRSLKHSALSVMIFWGFFCPKHVDGHSESAERGTRSSGSPLQNPARRRSHCPAATVSFRRDRFVIDFTKTNTRINN